jgi:hypothetical protein
MEVLTVSVITAQTFQATTNHEKGVPLSHIGLCWKGLPGTNTLAYYQTSKITDKKVS